MLDSSVPICVNDIKGARLFIPMSLGNHYYSNQILLFIIEHLLPNNSTSVLFLCDRLRFLSYMIRGVSPVKAAANIQIQLDQTRRTIIGLGFSQTESSKILDWSYLTERAGYQELCEELSTLCENDGVVCGMLRRYAERSLWNSGDGVVFSETNLEIQRQYIIEETALAIFMTELQGYNVEVYRRGIGFVDYLYEENVDFVRSITKKQRLERQFVSLEELVSNIT
jgi:tRNA-dependent cyclodipeptide synthase